MGAESKLLADNVLVLLIKLDVRREALCKCVYDMYAGVDDSFFSRPVFVFPGLIKGIYDVIRYVVHCSAKGIYRIDICMNMLL